jgi:hypothetical protein
MPTLADRAGAFLLGLACLPGHLARVAAFPFRRAWRALTGSSA